MFGGRGGGGVRIEDAKHFKPSRLSLFPASSIFPSLPVPWPWALRQPFDDLL